MVRAINQIGHTMNVMTIAESVEDKQTLQTVRDLGVDYAQGYAVAEPCALETALLGNEQANGADDFRKEKVTYLKRSPRNA